MNAEALTFTALVKLKLTVALSATDVAPLAGETEVTVGAASTVKEIASSAARCVPEASAICEATAVAVHTVPAGRLAVGVRVYVATPPGGAGLKVNATGVPVGQARVNAEALTFTALLKVNVTVLFTGTEVAPFTGDVLVTVGGESTVNENT